VSEVHELKDPEAMFCDGCKREVRDYVEVHVFARCGSHGAIAGACIRCAPLMLRDTADHVQNCVGLAKGLLGEPS
jgi:hypothetical protein